MAENIYRWELFSVDQIVQLLFQNGLITNIEARIMVCPPTMEERKVSMYNTIFSKSPESAQNIMDIIRINMHPLVNDKILINIFKFLKTTDIPNCRMVCQKWKNVVGPSNFSPNCPNKDKLNKNKLEQTLSYPLLQSLSYRAKRTIVSMFELMLTTNSSIKFKSTLPGIEEHKNAHPFAGRLQDDCGDAVDHLGCTSVTKALKNDMILNRVLVYLPVNQLKNCSRVCRQWNSAAERILAKRTKIIIRSSQQFHKFMAANKYSSIPDLPHTAFKFTSRSLMLNQSEISDFFSTFGHTIHSLDIMDKSEIYNDVIACVSFPHLTELYLNGSLNAYMAVEHPVPLDKLLSIKVLHLKSVIVRITDDTSKRISPVNILLENVKGSVDGIVQQEMTWNDYINFSDSNEIQITGNPHNVDEQKFDWTRDSINASKITLAYISFINWDTSKAKIDSLKITQCPLPDLPEKSKMQINKVVLEKGIYDIFQLPAAVKIVDVGHSDCAVRIMRQPQDLPSLNFLCIHGNLDFDYYNLWSLLSQNCPNLQDLKLMNFETLDVSWIPRSIQNLQIEGIEDFTGDDLEVINMHRLILRCPSSSSELTKVVDKIRPKVLVMTIDHLDWKKLLPFLKNTTQLEEKSIDCDVFQVPCLSDFKVDKIVVGFKCSYFSAFFNWSLNSTLFKCGLNPSRYYEFAKGCGNAINDLQFENYNRMIDEKA